MESLSNDLFQMLRNVLTQLPSLLTLLICLVIAVARWKRHPKVSLIASLTFVFLILHGLVFSAVYIWIPRWFLGSGSYEPNRTFFTALALITNFLFAVALATLLLAIFIDRRRATASS
jgi:predicted neutral ceramidase superfamily lipid hydrolase